MQQDTTSSHNSTKPVVVGSTVILGDFNASINIKKQGLKTLSGSGIESDIKQKRGKALPLGESMTHEAHPISFAVGG